MSSETKNILLKGKNVFTNSDLTNTENVKTLYNSYAKKLLAYTLKNYTISKDDAWTVVYKSIYKMAEKQGVYSFENEQKLRSFLFTTHINFLKNFFRDNKSFESKHREIELADEHAVSAEVVVVVENENLKILQNELDKLEDWQRILLLMRTQDVPYSKIAEFVNKPENQLKVYYARLKKQIHESVSHQVSIIKNSSNA